MGLRLRPAEQSGDFRSVDARGLRRLLLDQQPRLGPHEFSDDCQRAHPGLGFPMAHRPEQPAAERRRYGSIAFVRFPVRRSSVVISDRSPESSSLVRANSSGNRVQRTISSSWPSALWYTDTSPQRAFPCGRPGCLPRPGCLVLASWGHPALRGLAAVLNVATHGIRHICDQPQISPHKSTVEKLLTTCSEWCAGEDESKRRFPPIDVAASTFAGGGRVSF